MDCIRARFRDCIGKLLICCWAFFSPIKSSERAFGVKGLTQLTIPRLFLVSVLLAQPRQASISCLCLRSRGERRHKQENSELSRLFCVTSYVCLLCYCVRFVLTLKHGWFCKHVDVCVDIFRFDLPTTTKPGEEVAYTLVVSQLKKTREVRCCIRYTKRCGSVYCNFKCGRVSRVIATWVNLLGSGNGSPDIYASRRIALAVSSCTSNS